MNNSIAWDVRPVEVANLFNPAYFSLLINHMAEGYKEEAGVGLPYPLIFMALPLLLHEKSAQSLPKTSRTKLHAWLQQNPEVLFGFAERCVRLAPFVREAIFFGGEYGAFSVDETGAVRAAKLKNLKNWLSKWDFPPVDMSRAQLIGKMFGQLNDQVSLFTMFGVRP